LGGNGQAGDAAEQAFKAAALICLTNGRGMQRETRQLGQHPAEALD